MMLIIGIMLFQPCQTHLGLLTWIGEMCVIVIISKIRCFPSYNKWKRIWQMWHQEYVPLRPTGSESQSQCWCWCGDVCFALSKCLILIDQIELDNGSASRPCRNAHFFGWVITGRARAMFDAQFYFLVVRHRFDDGFDHGTQNSSALRHCRIIQKEREAHKKCSVET